MKYRVYFVQQHKLITQNEGWGEDIEADGFNVRPDAYVFFRGEEVVMAYTREHVLKVRPMYEAGSQEEA